MDTASLPDASRAGAGAPAGPTAPAHFGDPAAEYAAAQRGVVAVWRSLEGRLRAVGRDRLDLLHRMSTNDLVSLAVGQARMTVLTTPIGRIVDVLWVLNRGETVLALTGPGRATLVRRWLSSYIFYNDQVKFEDATRELGQIGLFGPGAAGVAQALQPGAASLPEDHFDDDAGLVVARGRPLAGDGFTLIGPAAQLPDVWSQALSAGAVPAGETAYQWLRLKAGVPEGGGEGDQAGQELTEAYIPLEANLWHAVSFTKGCYIGQEIIARMESRGKLARRLVGLRLEAPTSVGADVHLAGGGPATGHVTSAGVLPDCGPVALAYLKATAAEAGTLIRVGEAAGEVVELPFRP
ncbi:MAG: folate-binding protein YgfZ [Anaerolineales bacterium]|nr:folate-binding protein YgfZ [Anaerolineales bacterium]